MNKESYLKKFHELSFNSIKNGLGIITKINVDFDNIYSKIGKINYVSNKKIFTIEEISKENNFMKKIRNLLENPLLENKLDYLHMALRDIKILIIDENGEYLINREILGNQYSHLIIYVTENIDATIFITTRGYENKDESYALNNNSELIFTDFLDVYVDNNSNIRLVELRDINRFIYSRKNVEVNKNSNIYWTNIEGPSKMNISSLNSRIYGENSGSILNTLLLSENSEYNFFTRTDHYSVNTKSLMQARAIIKNSKAILRGLVYINENANNSNGYQKNEIILLDNNSRAVSIPDLEIHNNEVKCTHGSTITRIDGEKVFYVQSRGLTKEDSEKLLLKGFYEKALLEIPNGLKENVSSEIEKILYKQ